MPLQRTESVEGERRREGHRPEELEKDGSPQAGHGSAGERGLGHSQVLRWRMLGPGPGAQTGDSRAKQIFFFFFFTSTRETVKLHRWRGKSEQS